MKKIFGFASVFALAAGFSLSSCSSDDVAEDMNPNYDGNAEVVKTQFAISVPGSAKKSSRMTEDETQTGSKVGVFTGMKNIQVLTFSGAKNYSDEELAAATVKGDFPLETISGLSGEAKGKVYGDVKIDLGVDRMLFYGESNYGPAQGKLSADLNYVVGATNIQNIKFSPVQVDASAEKFLADAQGVQILAVLNNLAAVAGWEEAQDESSLKNLYNNFLKLKNGSAVVVAGAASKLYSSLDDLAARSESQEVAEALIAELNKYFEVSGEQGERTLSWKQSTNSDYATVVENFPENLNLPAGVALLSHTTGSFAYDVESQGNHLNGPKFTVVDNIVSPASLYYFANSKLAVSDNNQNLATKLSENNTWKDIISGYADGSGVVTFQTRSVSLRDQVQYAVGQLRTAVAVANGKIVDADNRQVDVNGLKNFPVTGVLVGGQKTVDWKFEQISDEKAYTIYDNQVPVGMKATKSGLSASNPTLVLESAPETDAYIAVEFVNNCDDFQGKDGLVKKGSKFYLVAQLKYAEGKLDHGKGTAVTKVFQKDYFTNANLTINHLKNAYLTIPDLRAAKMEFGLSVELTWSQGLTFDTSFD